MLTPGGPPTPGYQDRQHRRRVRPSHAGLSRHDPAFDVGTLLGTQWPSDPCQAPRTGWQRLAIAMLAEACRDSGLARRRGRGRPRGRPRDQHSAARWLLEADATAPPLPLDTACALAGLDPDRVRAVARLCLP